MERVKPDFTTGNGSSSPGMMNLCIPPRAGLWAVLHLLMMTHI